MDELDYATNIYRIRYAIAMFEDCSLSDEQEYVLDLLNEELKKAPRNIHLLADQMENEE
jgi:hypothetical protein